MIHKISGYFNGTGAAVYLCLGAIPRRVRLINLGVATNPRQIIWDKSMLGGYLMYSGLYQVGTGAITKKTTTGVYPYEGGDKLTSDNQTSVAWGEGIYLGWDMKDYRKDFTYGSATNNRPIAKWTLGSAANRTGYFDVDGVASGCRIGVGSIVTIQENKTGLIKKAAITALTSTPTFTTADYVTLSRAIGTGSIVHIGGQYQLAPIAIGKFTPAGIYIADTTVNVNNNVIMFQMEIDQTVP